MTRINLVSPKELTDQHLMREYQELPRIVGLVRKAIHKGRKPSDFKIASDYILGSGHVTFFYNKLEFLRKRQLSLIAELLVREYKIVHQEGLDLYDIPNERRLYTYKQWINTIQRTYKRKDFNEASMV